MQLLEALNWRYAVKRMNGFKLPEEKINRILEAVRLSPSAYGLQPYNIYMIESEDLKKRIRLAAFDQPQVTECSHLLVFAAWDNVTEIHVQDYLSFVAAERNLTIDKLEKLKHHIMKFVNSRTAKEKHEWAVRQTYLTLGTAITAAALEGVDSIPIEGFSPDEVDKILNLKDRGLKSAALFALGYRDEENDFLAKAKKVRRPIQKLIIMT
ncbi:MAG: NAD(P)H-dependent oxidoreductase [Ignavibacteria bacterium]